MARVRGWTVWAKSGERLRQFTVAESSEGEALATFQQAHPDLEVVSRQAPSVFQVAASERDRRSPIGQTSPALDRNRRLPRRRT
jgi:hypothetical protein